jgi:putative spermidine/putrescine transport system substrate-binding protein
LERPIWLFAGGLTKEGNVMDVPTEHRQSGATRRNVLKGAAATGAALAASSIPGAAKAADNVIRGYGVNTGALKDWGLFANSTGLVMDYTETNTDPGVFIRDVVAREIGEDYDFFVFDGGMEDVLGPQGIFLEVDQSHPELTLWDRTSKDFKYAGITQDDEGRQWGFPMVNNADSFGFWPEDLDIADPLAPTTWEFVFESEKTRGRVAVDKEWAVTMVHAGWWLNTSGQASIPDPTNMTGEEAKLVADYLIGRKKAGQFRTFYGGFDEQVELLGNKEVIAITCWEPAIIEVNLQHDKEVVFYAYAEYHFKWGHVFFIPSQAANRANLADIYRTANYFLGGEYTAYQAVERGYVGPNSDLAIEYAKANNWPEEKISIITKAGSKVNRKYAIEPFWGDYVPPNGSLMEEEFQRVLNA